MEKKEDIGRRDGLGPETEKWDGEGNGIVTKIKTRGEMCDEKTKLRWDDSERTSTGRLQAVTVTVIITHITLLNNIFICRQCFVIFKIQDITIVIALVKQHKV